MPDAKAPSRGLVRIRVPKKLFGRGRSSRSKSRDPEPRNPEPLCGDHTLCVRLPGKPAPPPTGVKGSSAVPLDVVDLLSSGEGISADVLSLIFEPHDLNGLNKLKHVCRTWHALAGAEEGLRAVLVHDRTFGRRGKASGKLDLKGFPCHLTALPGGEICIADTDSHRLQVLSASGEFIRDIGKFGTGAGQLYHPQAVVCDGDALYVTDSRHCSVEKIRCPRLEPARPPRRHTPPNTRAP